MAVPKSAGGSGSPKSSPKKPVQLSRFATSCKSAACEKAVQIAATAHEASNALLVAYELVRETRGRPRGMTTDNEQDLLRSMLVMAAAGLDAAVKQLVQDALPQLIELDSKAQNSFEKFIARQLSGDFGSSTSSAAGSATTNSRLLAAVLASKNPQGRLIAEYVANLTNGSLQSTESLFQIAAALGADPNNLGLNQVELRPIFDTRNKIIHELDINLEARKRTRTVRSQSTMIQHANRLFRLSHALIDSVDGRLQQGGR